MTESNISKSILLAIGKTKARLFRNNVGRAWTGNKVVTNKDGSITIFDPRPFIAGVAGMSDLIGFTPTAVTPEMVGETIAVYTAVEVKTHKGRPTVEQLNFLQFVKDNGGLAGVARSPEDALSIIQIQGEPGEK